MSPEHCAECGAYLSTLTDQTLHEAWHHALTAALDAIPKPLATPEQP